MLLYYFFKGWSKNFFPSIITLQSFISTFGIQNLLLLVFCASPSNVKTKSLFTPWKRGSIKRFEFGSRANNSGFGRYLFPLIVLLKPYFNCGNNFVVLELSF